MAYSDTFITVAEDCPINESEVPTTKRPKKPAHLIQYELVTSKPYHFDHKNLIFETYCIQNDLTDLATDERQATWDKLFSKGHPCLRASSLTKRYAFGGHYNSNGKIAIYPIESKEYQYFIKDSSVKKVPAMKSKR